MSDSVKLLVDFKRQFGPDGYARAYWHAGYIYWGVKIPNIVDYTLFEQNMEFEDIFILIFCLHFLLVFADTLQYLPITSNL